MSSRDNILLIQSIFKKTVERFKGGDSLESLIKNAPNGFSSLVCEAISSCLTTDVFEGNNNAKWKTFFETYSTNYKNQILIGVGWSAASHNHNYSLTNGLGIDNKDVFWVVDGMAYYDVLFNRRLTVRQRSIPLEINEKHTGAYTQGVGRGLWYITGGDPDRLVDIISHFEPIRHKDLWRGAGVAAAFVGVNSSLAIDKIRSLSGEHFNSFTVGVFQANDTCNKTNEIREEQRLVFKHFEAVLLKLNPIVNRSMFYCENRELEKLIDPFL